MWDDEKSAIGLTSRGYRGGPNLRSLVCSAILHIFVVSVLFWFSGDGKTVATPTLYAQVIEPHHDRIIWYHLKTIPRIDPQRRREAAQVKAEKTGQDLIIL